MGVCFAVRFFTVVRDYIVSNYSPPLCSTIQNKGL